MKHKHKRALPTPQAVAAGMIVMIVTTATPTSAHIESLGNAMLIGWFSSSLFATAVNALVEKHMEQNSALPLGSKGATGPSVNLAAGMIADEHDPISDSSVIRVDAPERVTF